MERPRRNIRPPGALSDYLIDDTEKKSSIPEDGTSDTAVDAQREDSPIQMNSKESKKMVLAHPYKCGECKARYRSKVALLRHAVKHSGDKPFTCPECGKGLSSQCALSEHMNIHTNSRPHRCEECGQESRQLSVHLRHLLTHQSHPDHVYSCPICRKSFKQNEYLRRHMRKHRGEKPFTCKECGKSFTCKSELNRHKRRHSSERPYTCQECGQAFKMRHNLRTHIKAHAGTQQWKCLVCLEVFSKPKLLEAHRKTHTESVQCLEVKRPSNNTLIVTTEGEDRRRLPKVHNVSLPQKEPENAPSSKTAPKKFLRINDTQIPLEYVLSSVGKGNNMIIKIIDTPLHSKPEALPNVENIVELVDAEQQELQEGGASSNQHNESNKDENHKGIHKEEQVQIVNSEPVQVESVLSASDSFESHCLSEHYLQVNPGSEDYRCWLATCVSYCQQLDPPFDPEICKLLHQITKSLQLCLVYGPKQSDIKSEPPDLDDPEGTIFCSDMSEYQFIYEQYLMFMEKLQLHFTYHLKNVE